MQYAYNRTKIEKIFFIRSTSREIYYAHDVIFRAFLQNKPSLTSAQVTSHQKKEGLSGPKSRQPYPLLLMSNKRVIL